MKNSKFLQVLYYGEIFIDIASIFSDDTYYDAYV